LLQSDASGIARWTTPYKVCTPTGVGTDNMCYGDNALQNNTTGDNNIAIGDSALMSNTTGDYNTAL
jgi:hypothetical protein